MTKVFAVTDRWHADRGLGEVRSDDSEFDDFVDFFSWVRQHGGTVDDVYIVEFDVSDDESIGDDDGHVSVKGGGHLGAVRRWMQRKALNGSEVTWGSDEVLRFGTTITPRVMEALAQEIREGCVRDVDDIVDRLMIPMQRIQKFVGNFDKGIATGTKVNAVNKVR